MRRLWRSQLSQPVLALLVFVCAVALRTQTATATGVTCDVEAALDPSAASLEAEAERAAQRDADLCSIERIPATAFSSLDFFRRFYQRAPFILTNYTANTGAFRRASSVESLLRSYGDETIEAASGNTYSHTRRSVLFREYVAAARARPLGLEEQADQTSYFFGDHDDPNEWRSGEELQRAVEEQQQQRRQKRTCGAADASESDDASGTPLCQPPAANEDEELDPESLPARSRPIWAKLLRTYKPPPFVVPQNLIDELAAKSGAATAAPKLTGAEVDKSGGAAAPVRPRSPADQMFESAQASGPSAPGSFAASAEGEEPLPPRFDFVRYSFGLGGHRSGVPFHFHGAAIGEVLHGAKRWFLFPPSAADAAPAPSSSASPFAAQSSAGVAANQATATAAADGSDSASPDTAGALPFPSFRPHLSQLQWLAHVYPYLAAPARPLQCTLRPGELVYIPGLWYHATTNLGFTEAAGGSDTDGDGDGAGEDRGAGEAVSVFISSFVDEPRLAGVIRAAGVDFEAVLAGRV